MWISKVSGEVHPVLIELEDPAKKYFRHQGPRPVQSHQFTEAVDQIGEWERWFGEPENELQFYKLYGVSDAVRIYHEVNPRYLLVYGRRSEFENDPSKSKALSRIRRRSSFEVMTFDRLTPLHESRHWITARVVRDRLHAAFVPPTFEINAFMLEWLKGIEGLEDAIQRNRLISDARRAFLLHRIPQLLKTLSRTRSGKPKPRELRAWE